MGTTARGLRYPEPTELLTNAHAHIKALAQDTNDEADGLQANIDSLRADVTANVGASFAHAGSPATADLGISDGANAYVDFGGVSIVGGWVATDPTTFTYSGPNRLVLVTCSLRVGPAAQPDNNFNVNAAIVQSGAIALEHKHALNVSSVDANISPVVTFSLTTVLGLTNGSTVRVRVENLNGFGETARVYTLNRSLKMTSLGLY